MWLSMLSIVSVTSVTSGKIISSDESKLTSLIGMTIFNNGLKFIFWGGGGTFRAMMSTARNISMDYNLPKREAVKGSFLYKCFERHIKNQHEKFLNGAEVYEIHVQYDGATIKDTPLLNILSGKGRR